MNPAGTSYLATDIGLWMSLPAFAPAFAVVAVLLFVVRRDRRRNPQADEAAEGPPPHAERNDK